MATWFQSAAALVAVWTALSISVGVGLGVVIRRGRSLHRSDPSDRPEDAVPTFLVTSTDVLTGAVLPRPHLGVAVGGDGVSPQLAWSGFPAPTAGFAITCVDVDAHEPHGSWCWAVVDLPSRNTVLRTDAGEPVRGLLPDSALTLLNDEDERRYGGPRPPDGTTHAVVLMVHALSVARLDVDPSAPASAQARTIEEHTLARGHLTVRAISRPAS